MANLNSRGEMYDYVVIGGGLAGLIMANRLQLNDHKVALVDAGTSLGGTCRPFFSPYGMLDHGLQFFPHTATAEELLSWAESTLNLSLEKSLIEAPPVTYDNGRFQPFVGFGSEKIEASSEFAYYGSQSHYHLKSKPGHWIVQLTQCFQGDVYLQSHLTKLTIDGDRISEILLNGTKRLTAKNYIFCAPPSLLARLLTDDQLASRQRQKMSKGPYWSSIHLDLIHSQPVTDSRSVHMLKGSNEEPCLGQFHDGQTSSSGETLYHSQWLTFVRADFTSDDELTATALKKIKRQLKRAYPNSLDHIAFERILVSEASHGEAAMSLNPDRRLPKLENLWISSRFFGPERNGLGVFRECKELFRCLGDSDDLKLPDPSPQTHQEVPPSTSVDSEITL